jgi:hypothetical protein
MSTYKIINSDNEVINTIIASLDFCEEIFPDCTYEPQLNVELTVEEKAMQEGQEAREWRDDELSATDYIVPLSDHPQRDAYITYRQSLRQWPSTDAWPATRPELEE